MSYVGFRSGEEVRAKFYLYTKLINISILKSAFENRRLFFTWREPRINISLTFHKNNFTSNDFHNLIVFLC